MDSALHDFSWDLDQASLKALGQRILAERPGGKRAEDVARCGVEVHMTLDTGEISLAFLLFHGTRAAAVEQVQQMARAFAGAVERRMLGAADAQGVSAAMVGAGRT